MNIAIHMYCIDNDWTLSYLKMKISIHIYYKDIDWTYYYLGMQRARKIPEILETFRGKFREFWRSGNFRKFWEFSIST